MKGYEKLIAWQLADEFAYKVYTISNSFPRYEPITSQLRRAALSIPTNLAEGSGRQNKNERRQFANISLGSLAEAQYLIHFAKKIGFLSSNDETNLLQSANDLGAVLWGFYKSF